MILLLVFAFIAGIVTILSPCILPILPIVLSSTIGGHESGKSRPIGVVLGFILSFTFFTLFLSTIVRITGIPPSTLRILSVVIIAGFGISFLIPQFQTLIERSFSKLAGFVPSSQNRVGFGGGIIIGLSLGLLWTPCVGPILASVIALAITGSVTLEAFLITFAYSLGTAIPMFLILIGGQTALRRVPWLLRNTTNIQKVFGVAMIIVAIGIFFNFDRKFQTFILNAFPTYGTGLTKFEDNDMVRNQLGNVTQTGVKQEDMGKPTSDLLDAKGPLAPEIIPGGEWFNPLPNMETRGDILKSLRGKVVVVDFWTYSCINCQRTFPYLRDWWSKYKDKGLVIIGVHSPEFEFEKEAKNVKMAIDDFELTYPVVQDNSFATWRAYDNLYWPAKYFIDKNGYIRYTHFGEGDYAQSEKVIQELLKEAGSDVGNEKINNSNYQTYSKTPETYLGYQRLENFASNEQIKFDTNASYTAPQEIPNNYVAYTGNWTVSSEYANPEKGAQLFINFEAKEVFIVMRPKASVTAKVRVYIDGKVQDFGVDNKNGVVTVDSAKLYKLINLSSPGRHTLRLEFLDNNAQLFAFTFG